MAMIRSVGDLGPLVDTGSRAGPWAPAVYQQAPIPFAPGVSVADVEAAAAAPAETPTPWLLLGGIGLLGYLVLK